MQNKKKIGLILGILLLIVSVSFGYYLMQVVFDGDGTAVNLSSIIDIGEITVEVEADDIMLGENASIKPGHKAVTKLTVTATGPESLIGINLNWNVNEDIEESLRLSEMNYSVYKTNDSTINLEVTCEPAYDVLGNNTYHYEICDVSNLDNDNISKVPSIEAKSVIKNSDTTVTIAEAEPLQATEEGSKMYYFVVFEYPNKSVDQLYDEGNKFSGEISVSASNDVKDYVIACGEECKKILTKKEILARTDFETPFLDDTTDVMYYENTSLGTSFYYAGAPTDNYVEFAGYYWRIIRINENGSIRMIYSGEKSQIDELGKETILANGYDDSSDGYTQIGTSKFNTTYDQAEYVGFKYTLGSVHGTEINSTVLEELEKWYTSEDNELQNYEQYLDTESGFCGDRSAYTNKSGTTAGGGTGTTVAYYVSYIRNQANKEPSFECSEEDLYKTEIGLISADEVAYAGGRAGSGENKGYYLYTGYYYWTMSPSHYDGADARVYRISSNGIFVYASVGRATSSIRPVINLSLDNLTISGSGTILDPYIIREGLSL